MPTAEEVKAQLNNLDGGTKFVGHREIGELPKLLWGDERIEGLIAGMYNSGTGVLVATDRRLIFLDKSMLGGLKMEEFPYDKISTIQSSTGLLMGSVTIFTSGNKAEIKNVIKSEVRPFADRVRILIAQKAGSHATATPLPAQAAGDGDMLSKLEKLGKLKEQGVLTEDEFQEQKRRILAAG